jgi:hypothetical protein
MGKSMRCNMEKLDENWGAHDFRIYATDVTSMIHAKKMPNGQVPIISVTELSNGVPSDIEVNKLRVQHIK